MNLTDKCGYYERSRTQKEMGIKTELEKRGTKKFREIDCQKWNGYNFDCPAYFSPLEMYKKGNRKLENIKLDALCTLNETEAKK